MLHSLCAAIKLSTILALQPLASRCVTCCRHKMATTMHATPRAIDGAGAAAGRPNADGYRVAAGRTLRCACYIKGSKPAGRASNSFSILHAHNGWHWRQSWADAFVHRRAVRVQQCTFHICMQSITAAPCCTPSHLSIDPCQKALIHPNDEPDTVCLASAACRRPRITRSLSCPLWRCQHMIPSKRSRSKGFNRSHSTCLPWIAQEYLRIC